MVGIAMTNRFERVSEPRDGAIVVSVYSTGGEICARVDFPPKAESGGITAPIQLVDHVPLRNSLHRAVEYANRNGLKIVVVDPEGLWPSGLGELYTV